MISTTLACTRTSIEHHTPSTKASVVHYAHHVTFQTDPNL